MKTKTKSKPVQEIRLGRIKASIWANESEQNGPRYNVTVCRIYKLKPETKEWSFSDSFGRDDLLVLGKVLDLAHTWIFEHGVKSEAA